MTKWRKFWRNYRNIEISDERDLLFQVGKTINKKPIDNVQFNKIINSIDRSLELHKKDCLLDICCGNGVVTNILTHLVNNVVGIDFSDPFINNANKFYSNKKITFVCGDALDFDLICRKNEFIPNKILIYDALAYFTNDELDLLLQKLKNIIPKDARILFASVLNMDKQSNFYNTPYRKIKKIIDYNILNRNYGIGKWWEKKEIHHLAKSNGFKVKFIDQDPRIYTSHYRFDCLLIKNI